MSTQRFRDFINRGDALYYLRRYKQAIIEYRKAATEKGDSVIPLHRMGYCYYLLGEMENAAEINKVAFEKEPGHSYNFYLDGIIKIATDRSFEGINSLLKSLEINPQFTPCYSALAHIYLKNNSYETAINYAKQGLAIDPTVTPCHTALCTAYAKLDKRKDFYAAIKTALQIAPEDSDVHEAAGLGYLQFKDFELSKTHYNEALRLRPNSKTADALESVSAHEDVSWGSDFALIVGGLVFFYFLVEIIKHLFF